MLFTGLLALSFGFFQDPGSFPKPGDYQPSAEYLNWSGFGFLPNGARTILNDFRSAGDWSAVQASTAKPADDGAVTWRLKVFVIHRLDRLRHLTDGTVYEEQTSLETPDTERIQRSLAQLQALVALQSHGKLKLAVDVSTESDPVLSGESPYEKTLAEYIYPRFNGGSYEADDGIYRGPFSSVLCIHPVPDPDPKFGVVNGTPVSYLSAYGPSNYDADGLFAIALDRIWCEQVRTISRASGILGPSASMPLVDPVTGLVSPLPYVPGEDWKSLLEGPELDPAVIESRLELPVAIPQAAPADEAKLYFNTYKGTSSEPTIETDPQHGSVLNYFEHGTARNGGLDFPTSSAGPIVQVGTTPTLDFWCKSSSKDPLALTFWSSDGRAQEVSLGRDLPGPSAIPEANFERDGQWHLVKLNLASMPIKEITGISLQPTPNSRTHPKITLGAVQYSFAAFRATTDLADPNLAPVAPDGDSPDAWSRAEWAHAAPESAKLASLLKDPEWMVRLNAIRRYIAKPDPSVEPLLTDNVTSAIDGAVNAAALEALWALQTDTAKAVVGQALKTEITEQGKAEAARLMVTTKNPDLAEALITLSQSRTLGTRIADVQALGQLPGSSAALIRMSLLAQSDPQMKLEITRTANPEDAYQVSKLLWSSVNETSDAVRAESDLVLLASKDPKVRDDGFHGIKDDSVGVRLILLENFAEHPEESQRAAIRVAITDRSARVRAAALRAFAALPKEVTLDELGTVVADQHPIVQIALTELVRKKGLKLPEQSVSQIKNSLDPQVRIAAEGVF